MELYKNYEWMHQEYYVNKRTIKDIAKELGVATSTVAVWLKRLEIPTLKRPSDSNTLKILTCSYCNEEFESTLRNFKRGTNRRNQSSFYCTHTCYGNSMKGKIPKQALRTKEANNMWKGGKKIYECYICKNPCEKHPFEQRLIESGERKATCSNLCAGALGRRNMPTSRTSIEIKMADELTRRGIEYVEQYILGDKFRLDFLLPTHNIVIECDGDYWHNLPNVVIRDKSKNAYIKACGYSLYRFWEHEINTDVSACVDKVLEEILDAK